MNASATAAANTRLQAVHDSGARAGHWRRFAAPALQAVGGLWLGVAVLGQLLLAFYVVAYYWRSAAAGNWQAWNEILAQGLMPGRPVLNAVLIAHLFFVVVIIVGGSLQLLPPVRQAMPAFHRWTGRLYLLAASVLSLGGLALGWLGGHVVGDLPQHLGVSFNALAILGCAAMAGVHARARRIQAHRRWALRLFLVVGGVWFFRIGLMLWLMINQGPAGFDPKTFTGPALSVLSFAQWMLPLAVLELYLRVRARGAAPAQLALAAGLLVLSLATVAGVGGAAFRMWLPRLGLI